MGASPLLFKDSRSEIDKSEMETVDRESSVVTTQVGTIHCYYRQMCFRHIGKT